MARHYANCGASPCRAARHFAWLDRENQLGKFTDEIGMKRASFVGMLADFGVEGYDLNLYTDKTSRDSSLLPAAVSRYLAKVKVLFIDGKALEMGCTRVMLEAAKQVAVW